MKLAKDYLPDIELAIGRLSAGETIVGIIEKIQKDALESAAGAVGNTEDSDAILLIHPKGKMIGDEYPNTKAVIEL